MQATLAEAAHRVVLASGGRVELVPDHTLAAEKRIALVPPRAKNR